MPEYAAKECDYCGVILPAYEFRRVSDSYLAAKSYHHRSYTGVNGHRGSGGGTSSTYKYHTSTLCPDCFDARRRAQARRFAIRAVGVAVAAVIVVWVLVNQSPRPTGATLTTDNTIANVLTPPPAIELTPETIDNPEADEGEQQSGTADQAPVPDSATPTPLAKEAPSIVDNADASSTLGPRQPSIESALNEGKTKRWSIDGRSGYILVSDPQTYADKTCRNVTVTRFSGQDQQQDSPIMWCRSLAGGEWSAAQ
jgi:hypothetical protein